MGLFSAAKLFGMTIRESANDGSDFTNPDADYRRLFLGEDGELHAKDSAGTVTTLGAGGALTDHTHDATGSGSDGGGVTLAPDSLTVRAFLAFASGIDSTVNADQNNFAPSGLHTTFSVRFTSFTANRTLTGLEAGSTGEMKLLINNTSFSLLLANESGSSTDVNRFRSPNAATHTVRQSGSVLLGYFAGRWCVIAA